MSVHNVGILTFKHVHCNNIHADFQNPTARAVKNAKKRRKCSQMLYIMLHRYPCQGL